MYETRNMMKKIPEVFRILFAYLARPRYYSELIRKIHQHIVQRDFSPEKSAQAIKWCAQKAISQEEALKKLFPNLPPISLERQHWQDFLWAQHAAQQCPVTMGGAGMLDLIYGLSEYTQSQNILETGVAYGWSSLAALLSLQKRQGRLYSSDMPYMGKDNDGFVGCLVPEHLKKYWKLYRFADRDALYKIFREQPIFDLVHYDSDKSYNGRAWAYPLLWNAVRKGGVFMSDDIEDNTAFMDFCTSHQLEPTVVELKGKYAGFVIKSF